MFFFFFEEKIYWGLVKINKQIYSRDIHHFGMLYWPSRDFTVFAVFSTDQHLIG